MWQTHAPFQPDFSALTGGAVAIIGNLLWLMQPAPGCQSIQRCSRLALVDDNRIARRRSNDQKHKDRPIVPPRLYAAGDTFDNQQPIIHIRASGAGLQARR